MFGYLKSDIDKVGYFGKDNNVVDELSAAQLFVGKRGQKTGTPEDWLLFINSDKDLNQGYKFHLVKTLFFKNKKATAER